MSRKSTNQPEYGTELKLAAVRRVLAGESASAVGEELDPGIQRSKIIERWIPTPSSSPPLVKDV